MNKRDLTETDIRSKFITPAIRAAGRDDSLQIREEVFFTKGRIIELQGVSIYSMG